MKKVLIMLLICNSLYSQKEYKITDSNFKKLVNINSEVANKVKFIEHLLQGNQKRINKNDFDLIDPSIPQTNNFVSNLSEKEQKKIKELVCIECYDKWWQNQLLEENKLIEFKKKEKDSIDSIRIKNTLLDKKRKDSLSNIVKVSTPMLEKDNPYDLLERSLYAFSKTNRDLAVFRKTDYNYCSPRLSSYLQSNMGLSSKDFKISKTEVTEKFIPKVSNGNEYLTVKYFVTTRNDIAGIYSSDEVMIVDSLEITGTANIVIKLFLNYWSQGVKIGGYKQGDIAFKEILADYITISGINPNLYKIKITKGNMDIDYETTYGINKKK